MSRAARKHSPLKIKRSVIDKLLMYGLSRNEFGALLFGRDNVIIEVRRIRNTDTFRSDYFEWDHRQRIQEVERAKTDGLCLLAEGHSHPKASHSSRLSRMDLNYFNRQLPHLLIHSKSQKVTAWSSGERRPVRIVTIS